MISSFEDLLAYSRQQEGELLLLLLFAKAGDVTVSQGDATTETTTSTLEPLICVDKLPSEVRNFETLVSEADAINSGWDLLFVAGLSGEVSRDPKNDEAGLYLNQMANDVKTGQNISRYLAFNRDNETLTMQVSS